jgi:small-conductance mechanosensitive channel
VREWLVSLAILLGSYLGAWIVSWILGSALLARVRRTPSPFDDRLAVALKGPLTWALFIVGAYVAVRRLPVDPRWTTPIDAALFIFSVLLITVALIRSFGLVLAWYTQSSPAAASEVATEFGPLIGKIGKVFIALVAVIAVFEHFQVNVASLVVSLGVGSLAVGLAAQDTLSNMFAGFTLLMDRPFRIGERVRLATGETGDVQAIGIRATLIKTLDETILVVPNSLLVKERLTNLSRPARSISASVEVAVPYGTDLEQLKALLVDAAAGSESVSPEPRPSVLVQRFGEYALHVSLGFHARDYASAGAAKSEVHERAYGALRKAGIEIAVKPQPAVRA